MKVVNAVWEKRNLGVETVEFEMEKTDTLEIINKTIISNEKQYNVVKVINGDFSVKTMLADMGYIFMESMFKLTHNTKMPLISPTIKRIVDKITYLPMDEQDIERLFSEIDKNMFITDRIARDPFFSIDTANKRYINWIKDELDRGNHINKGVYEGNTFGFCAYKTIDKNVIFPYLGGTYNDYLGCGIALPATYASIKTLVEKKPKQFVTYVSSNNYSALMSNIFAGFNIRQVSDVYIKHNH